MKTATLGQIQKILSYLADVTEKKVQQFIELGLVFDFFRADPSEVNRAVLRKALGLKSLVAEIEMWNFSVPAIPEQPAAQLFRNNVSKAEWFLWLCQTQSEEQTWSRGVHTSGEERDASREEFNGCFSVMQSSTDGSSLYMCPIGKHNSALSFARYIVGKSGSVEDVSDLLIENGHCVTLSEIEYILECHAGHLSSGSTSMGQYSTGGLWFFVRNIQGLVSVVHMTGSRHGYPSRGFHLVVRPLEEGGWFRGGMLGHETFVVRESK